MRLKDPVSGLSHLLGVFLSILGLVLLVTFGARQGTAWHVVSFSIFGASLILLYLASTLYHLLPLSPEGTRVLRTIDHMMIYVLISGTYTPVCLIALRGAWGWTLFSVIWALAILGMVLKLFWLEAPRWLYTLFYVGMGWLAVIAFVPLLRAIPLQGVLWLLLGGVLYSAGALLYGLKWPRGIPGWFGFHEIFHLFIMAGSFSHFWMMWRYILPLNI